MVIDEFHVRRTLGGPPKAQTKLIVDADAVLPLPIALQRFEPVAGQRRQIMKDVRGVKAVELEPRGPLDARERFHALAGREVSRSLIAVADDHRVGL